LAFSIDSLLVGSVSERITWDNSVFVQLAFFGVTSDDVCDNWSVFIGLMPFLSPFYHKYQGTEGI